MDRTDRLTLISGGAPPFNVQRAMPSQPEAVSEPAEAAVPPAGLRASLVLVGLMGAGKTKVGRTLAKRLRVRFADADEAIVTAAGMSIPEIFATHGEARFRELERRVIARLLEEPPQVLALGGGAFMDESTRERCRERAVTVWLHADLDTLVARTGRKKGTRPLLAEGDPREKLAALMAVRDPVYALADLRVESGEAPAEAVAQRIEESLRARGILA